MSETCDNYLEEGDGKRSGTEVSCNICCMIVKRFYRSPEGSRCIDTVMDDGSHDPRFTRPAT